MSDENIGMTEPKVTRSWLRFNDVECVRGNHWCGPEGEPCFMVEGEGVVCDEHVTDAEKSRSVAQS